MLQFMQDGNTMSLDKFQADILATRAQYGRSDAMEWDGNGSGMDAILPVDVLSEGISEPDHEFRQRYQKAVDLPDIGPVSDIWSREFREGTCESLHPSICGFEIGRTPDLDYHDLWSPG